jgi:hypothetical protein
MQKPDTIQVTIFHEQYSPFHFNHFDTTSFLTKFSTTPKDPYERMKNQGSPPSINSGKESHLFVEVLKLRSHLSVCRGPETQIFNCKSKITARKPAWLLFSGFS